MNILPIIAAGGALLLLSGKKKKKSGNGKSNGDGGDQTDPDSSDSLPQGLPPGEHQVKIGSEVRLVPLDGNPIHAGTLRKIGGEIMAGDFSEFGGKEAGYYGYVFHRPIILEAGMETSHPDGGYNNYQWTLTAVP